MTASSESKREISDADDGVLELQRFDSVVGTTWPGLDGLAHLVIFGDSYSSVEYDPSCPHPTAHEPLGVHFPGITFADEHEETGDCANWVGHLIRLRSAVDATLLVYDYAVGGDTITGVRSQVQRRFLPTVGTKPDWAPWKAENTLFITWVGINDCAYSRKHDATLQKLFQLQEELYQVGARNFLFIDVPPIHRSPAVAEHRATSPNITMSYDNWNANLHRSARRFYSNHPDATILMFSSWDTFNNVLDDPEAFGFSHEDRRKFAGKIWVDHLHPSSRMHEIIAKDVECFLSEFPPYGLSQ